MCYVEMEGVEPSSKQWINMLSTCLSSPKFSCLNRTEATYPNLIPLVSENAPDLRFPIPDIAAPPVPFGFGKKAWGDVTSLPPRAGIKL